MSERDEASEAHSEHDGIQQW